MSFVPPLLALLLAAPAGHAGDLIVSLGDAVEGELAAVPRVVLRVVEPGALLATSSPVLVPAPPLLFARGDHAFRFADDTDSTRYTVRFETAGAVADRLARAAGEGDRDAVETIDTIAARSDAPAWRRARAEVHRAAGDHATALTDLGRAIGHHRTAAAIAAELGLADLEAPSRRALATSRFQIGDLDGALAEAARYRALEREGGDPCAAAAADSWYGGFLTVVGLAERAVEPLTAAATAAAALGDDALLATVTLRLGDVLEQRGEAARARSTFEEAIQLGRAARNDEVVADASIRVALLDLASFRLDPAMRRLRDVAAAAETPPFRRLDAIARLARGHHLAGDFAASLMVYEELSDQARAAGWPYFDALGRQGGANALTRLGDLAEARDRYRDALAAAAELGTDLRRNETLRALAALELHLGDTARAREYAGESLRLARDRRDRIEEVLALLLLATLHREEGRPDLAAERLDAAATRAEGEPNLESYVAVARIEHRLDVGEVDAARAAAARVRERLSGRRGSGGAARAVLPLLARASLAAGRPGEAEEAAREALSAAAPEDAAARLAPLAVLAEVALDRGERDAAAEALAEAADHLDRLAGRGLEIESATGLRSRHAGFAALRHDLTAAGRAAGDDGAVASGFLAAGAWKGRGLLEGIVEHRRGGRTREISLLRRRLSALRSRRAAVLEEAFERTYGRGEDVSQLRAEADRLRDEIEATTDELETRSPRDVALARPRGATAREVGALLREGDRLVEFTEGRRRLYAFVVDPDAVRFLDLGDLSLVRERVARFLAGISEPAGLAGAADVAAAGRALYELLLAEALVDGSTRRLLLVPSISLSVLPFEALVVESPPSPSSFAELTFLDDRMLTSYAPSSPVLAALAAAPPRGAGGRLLALADPVYAPTDGTDDPAAPPRIRESRGEALALARLGVSADPAASAALDALADVRSGSYEDARVAVHVGAAASRERLLEPLRDVRILHLAAHGVVRRDSPQASGLLLGRRDGAVDLFSIGDALALDLDAELVVLSACSTARGRPRRGEGIESLARAFLHAGARHVVASLWDVSDAAAIRTMERFYQALLQDARPPASALRDARRALRRTTVAATAGRGVGGVGAEAAGEVPSGHPFLWAPFVHVGTWE